MSTYAEFASVFDTIGLAHAGLLALQEIRRHAQPLVGRSLDLGCGTGLATIELAGAGWEVSGVDSSPEMLQIAGGRARDAGVSVTLIEADILWAGQTPGDRNRASWRNRADTGGSYQLPTSAHRQQFDLVTCLGDTLSELHEQGDLDRFCHNAALALSAGGLLAFDTRSPAEYATWDARDQVLSDADGLLVYTERDYHPHTDEATCRYGWFVSDGQRWWRSEETHLLRLWRPDAIRAALAAVGLEREREHDLGDGRTLYLARKRIDGR
jgi:SAM-dependent methyltransferase